MIDTTFIDTPWGPCDGKVPLVKVATAGGEADVFGIVAKAAVGVTEGHAAGHDVLVFLEEAFVGEFESAGDAVGAQASSTTGGGCCCCRRDNEQEKKEEIEEEEGGGGGGGEGIPPPSSVVVCSM